MFRIHPEALDFVFKAVSCNYVLWRDAIIRSLIDGTISGPADIWTV